MEHFQHSKLSWHITQTRVWTALTVILLPRLARRTRATGVLRVGSSTRAARKLSACPSTLASALRTAVQVSEGPRHYTTMEIELCLVVRA